ncbi:ATP-binding cassette domain-containing protein [Halalkalibacillus halophilus]|uniref:ATP-binding cassette domain-containing protein n=1 Tax=Halalkalibacillus halophilus TaxID=392827 RepID=UPI00041583A1|nr:ATP-binding cassette domain-containing protein [Halalkalibacillus halophilus]
MTKNIMINNLSFKYDSMVEPIFSDVNLNINERWKLALLGRNGRGKTTFLKCLLHEVVFAGHIDSPLTFKYFPKTISERQGNFYVQDLLLENNAHKESWELEVEVTKMNFSTEILKRPYKSLSGGEKTKVLLIELFLDENAFPLIDEPTNNLDIHGRNIVSTYLNSKNGFIVVSHDEKFLNSFVDHVLAMNKQSIDLLKGNIETWRTEKDNADRAAEEKNNKLKSEVKRLNNVSRQVNVWGNKRENSTKDSSERRLAAKQMKRSKAIKKRTDEMIEEKKNLIHNTEEETALKINVTQPVKQILSLRDFTILKDNQPLFVPITIDVQPGERLFIEGKNGVGKTTLLEYILGNKSFETIGEYDVRLPHHISSLKQSMLTEFDYTSFLFNLTNEEKEGFWYLLHQLGMHRSRFTNQSQPSWSAGEQKKILLAHALINKNELFVWDEVTNNLDFMVIDQLIQALNTYQPTMIGIDHNEKFVESVATKRIELTPYIS